MQILVVAYSAQMYAIPPWLDGIARTDIVPFVLTARRENCVRREDEKHRPTGLSDYRIQRAYGVKNKIARSNALGAERYVGLRMDLANVSQDET